jgi:signal transduction histidine kinase
MPAVALGLPEWRRRILDRALQVAALLGPAAYLPSLWLSWRERLWSLVVIDSLVYGWIVLLALRPAWPYAVRSGSLVVLAYLLAVVLVPTTGIHGAALPWFGVVPVLAAIFLGLRGGLFALVLCTATLAVLTVADLVPGAAPGSVGRLGWIITACNAMFLGGTLALAVAVLLRGLEETHQDLMREVEDRRRAETERGQLEVELRRSQSLEAIGTLASGVAHDVKNVLNPILTLTELAREDLTPESLAWRRLGDVLKAAERGRELADRIMSYGRHRTAPRARIRVATIVDEVGKLLRPAMRDGIRLEVDMRAPEAQVVADPVELHQVLLNLGTNALHAMDDRGGRLGIRVFWEAEGRVAIDVEDQGRGMDAATLDRAFHPFFTTKPDGEGTGLGLPMARRIIAGLGGSLELHSEPGTGTRAEIRLPAVRDGAGT